MKLNNNESKCRCKVDNTSIKSNSCLLKTILIRVNTIESNEKRREIEKMTSRESFREGREL